MIIDFHTHILPAAVRADRVPFLASDAAFAAIYADPAARIADAADLLDAIATHQLTAAVAAGYSFSTPALCALANDALLDAHRAQPARIFAFCAVNLDFFDDALAEIERCALAGASGIGELRIDTLDLDFSDPAVTRPFADLLRKHKLILLLHASEPVGHDYPGKGDATPGRLYPFLRDNPDIPVVLAHWGGGLPFYHLMPEVHKALPNVYYDTAASPYLYTPGIWDIAVKLVGSDRILFGSDFPLMPPSRIVKEIQSSGLDPYSQQKILSGNARRLLGID
jgi:predicted TIM-barrel fold metal-dependent hydrolase